MDLSLKLNKSSFLINRSSRSLDLEEVKLTFIVKAMTHGTNASMFVKDRFWDPWKPVWDSHQDLTEVMSASEKWVLIRACPEPLRSLRQLTSQLTISLWITGPLSEVFRPREIKVCHLTWH